MSQEQRDDKLHADTPRTNAHLSHLNLPDGRKVGIPDQTVALLRELERQSAGAVTKEMVDRFLSWKLPDDFHPDAGISFKREYNEGTPYPGKHQPIGTNLLNADQAKAMLEHVLAVVPSAVAALTDDEITRLIATAAQHLRTWATSTNKEPYRNTMEVALRLDALVAQLGSAPQSATAPLIQGPLPDDVDWSKMRPGPITFVPSDEPRVDWLQAHSASIYRSLGGDHWVVVDETAKVRKGNTGKTLRDAIDDAMKCDR